MVKNQYLQRKFSLLAAHSYPAPWHSKSSSSCACRQKLQFAFAGASSHSGRITFATHLIEKGIDIKSVSILMGYSSIYMTEKYIQENPLRLKKSQLKIFKKECAFSKS